MGTMAIQTIEAKTGLTKASLPEPFLISLYRAQAPYRGCTHGCRYCDGRAEKYYVEGDFQKDISVRENLPALVAQNVEGGIASREFGAVCIGSGVTDVYQPLERRTELTRKTLEALAPTGLPVIILTKNDLILRDFDVLARFPRVLVIVTVTTADPALARILEPGASPPAARLEVVRRAKAAGFHSGVMAMPLCPGISDTDANTGALFSAVQEAGADFLYPGGLTLRPGCQKDLFISLVDARFPELRPLYDQVYRENRPSGMPLISYTEPIMKRWNADLEKRRLPQLIPHRIYRELLSPPDSLFVLLCHMQTLYSIRGIDTRPLRLATDRYARWLTENRTSLRRKRIQVLPSDPFPITGLLTEKLTADCAKPDGFEAICGNPKLAAMVRRLVLENAYLDYSTLSVVDL